MRSFPRPLFLLPLLLSAVAAGDFAMEEGCASPQQAVVVTNDLGPEMQCVVTAVLNGGLTDPLLIATSCGGLAIPTIIAILDTLIAGATNDAGVFVNLDALPPKNADGSASAAAPVKIYRIFDFTDAQVTLFRVALVKARALAK